MIESTEVEARVFTYVGRQRQGKDVGRNRRRLGGIAFRPSHRRVWLAWQLAAVLITMAFLSGCGDQVRGLTSDEFLASEQPGSIRLTVDKVISGEIRSPECNEGAGRLLGVLQISTVCLLCRRETHVAVQG